MFQETIKHLSNILIVNLNTCDQVTWLISKATVRFLVPIYLSFTEGKHSLVGVDPGSCPGYGVGDRVKYNRPEPDLKYRNSE